MWNWKTDVWFRKYIGELESLRVQARTWPLEPSRWTRALFVRRVLPTVMEGKMEDVRALLETKFPGRTW